jgi:endonuclease/exonuclease/phosphatase (EEP) superfamily protein YafD
LPIDHVLVPVSSCVVRAEIGPSIGSDHRPVLVTLRRG